MVIVDQERCRRGKQRMHGSRSAETSGAAD